MARTKDPELEAARRALVAEATMGLLAEGSWRSVTLSAVAARAGVSKGVVTYWYANKDALILEAIRRHHARYEADLTRIALQPGATRARLEALIEAAFPSQALVAREVAFQAEVWSYTKEHPEVRDDILASYDRFRMACKILLSIGAAEGLVTVPERDSLSRFIHALIDGLSIHIAFEPEVDVPALRAELIEMLGRWFRA